MGIVTWEIGVLRGACDGWSWLTATVRGGRPANPVWFMIWTRKRGEATERALRAVSRSLGVMSSSSGEGGYSSVTLFVIRHVVALRLGFTAARRGSLRKSAPAAAHNEYFGNVLCSFGPEVQWKKDSDPPFVLFLFWSDRWSVLVLVMSSTLDAAYTWKRRRPLSLFCWQWLYLLIVWDQSIN